jgi:hypothetical protein
MFSREEHDMSYFWGHQIGDNEVGFNESLLLAMRAGLWSKEVKLGFGTETYSEDNNTVHAP